MADRDDDHGNVGVIDAADDAVISHPVAPEAVLRAAQGFAKLPRIARRRE